MSTTKLFLKPGTNYEIELESKVDQKELDEKGVTKIFVPERPGWIKVQNHWQLSPTADPDDADEYRFENGTKPTKR